METYSAQIAQWARAPIHQGYRRVAEEDAALYLRCGGRLRERRETTCPYCGRDAGVLFGRGKLGGKTPTLVRLTREGDDLGDERRSHDLLMLECGLCSAKFEPTAYSAPMTWYQNITNERLIPGHDEEEEELDILGLLGLLAVPAPAHAAAVTARGGPRGAPRTMQQGRQAATAQQAVQSTTASGSDDGHTAGSEVTEREAIMGRASTRAGSVTKESGAPRAVTGARGAVVGPRAAPDAALSGASGAPSAAAPAATAPAATASGARMAEGTVPPDDEWTGDVGDGMDGADDGLDYEEELQTVPSDTMLLDQRGIRRVSRELIDPDPEQPREYPDADLRESIRRRGLLKPPLVRRHPTVDGRFMIVDGERRWRATEGVQEQIFVIVRQDMDDRLTRLLTQVDANRHKPLSPVEEAMSYSQVWEALGHCPIRQLASVLGRDKKYVHERLKLLSLGPWLPFVRDGRIAFGPAGDFLYPLRGVPEQFQREAIERFTRHALWRERGSDLPSAQLGALIGEIYESYVYPLERGGIGRQPEPGFSVGEHDRTCRCEGPRWRGPDDDRVRRYCTDPGYWQPKVAELRAQRRRAQRSGSGQPASGTPYPVGGGPEGGSSLGSLFDAVLGDGRGSADPVLRVEPTVPHLAEEAARTQGVVLLTDLDGRWRVGSSGMEHEAFDPADLGLDTLPIVLVERETRSAALPRIGTKDRAAVQQARRQWKARWRGRYDALAAETAAELTKRVGAEAVRVGTRALAGLAQLVVRAEPAVVREVMSLLGVEMPEPLAVPRDGSPVGGTDDRALLEAFGAVPEEVRARVLAAVAHAVEGRVAMPSRRVREEQVTALQEISARQVPWIRPAEGGGATSDGATSDGATSDDATSDGAPSESATSGGAASRGTTGNGATVSRAATAGRASTPPGAPVTAAVGGAMRVEGSTPVSTPAIAPVEVRTKARGGRTGSKGGEAATSVKGGPVATPPLRVVPRRPESGQRATA